MDETKADTKAESKTAPAAVVDAADAPEDVGATGAVEETPSAAAAAPAQTSGVSCPFCNQHFRTSTTCVLRVCNAEQCGVRGPDTVVCDLHAVPSIICGESTASSFLTQSTCATWTVC